MLEKINRRIDSCFTCNKTSWVGALVVGKEICKDCISRCILCEACGSVSTKSLIFLGNKWICTLCVNAESKFSCRECTGTIYKENSSTEKQICDGCIAFTTKLKRKAVLAAKAEKRRKVGHPGGEGKNISSWKTTIGTKPLII